MGGSRRVGRAPRPPSQLYGKFNPVSHLVSVLESCALALPVCRSARSCPPPWDGCHRPSVCAPARLACSTDDSPACVARATGGTKLPPWGADALRVARRPEEKRISLEMRRGQSSTRRHLMGARRRGRAALRVFVPIHERGAQGYRWTRGGRGRGDGRQSSRWTPGTHIDGLSTYIYA